MHLFQENHQSSGSQTVKLSPDRIEKPTYSSCGTLCIAHRLLQQIWQTFPGIGLDGHWMGPCLIAVKELIINRTLLIRNFVCSRTIRP